MADKREIEQSEARDKLAKVLAGMVPLGSSAYELITTIVVPLHEKKKREFLNDLADRLKKLEDEGRIDYQELAESEEFNTIITKAILLAQQNHQEQKLEALRNVVLNSARELFSDQLDFTVTDFFLSILDRITPLHIHLLKFFQNPKPFTKKDKKQFFVTNEYNSTRLKILYLIYPDLQEKDVFIKVYWKEMFDFDLVRINSLNEDLSLKVSLNGVTTPLGNQFLKMIREPN